MNILDRIIAEWSGRWHVFIILWFVFIIAMIIISKTMDKSDYGN